MTSTKNHAVTGAFGYSGKYIAKRLLDKGVTVRTLTNSLHRENPFGDRIKAYPLVFDDYSRLVESMRGVEVLYNTYWVRFNHTLFNQKSAVENTHTLFNAAVEAGVRKIVHVSITNPSENSPLEYFSGKAKLEKYLLETGLNYTILRPGVLFGIEDILINNIAWLLRHFPIFGVFGNGEYKLQPIFVDDLAKLAVDEGCNHHDENKIIDAIGPETFTYRELVAVIAHAIQKNRPMISIPPAMGHIIGWFIGKLKNDVVITRQEIAGLMSNLLYTDSTPTGTTKFSSWVNENANLLGTTYKSEVARRKNTLDSYDQI